MSTDTQGVQSRSAKLFIPNSSTDGFLIRNTSHSLPPSKVAKNVKARLNPRGSMYSFYGMQGLKRSRT